MASYCFWLRDEFSPCITEKQQKILIKLGNHTWLQTKLSTGVNLHRAIEINVSKGTWPCNQEPKGAVATKMLTLQPWDLSLISCSLAQEESSARLVSTFFSRAIKILIPQPLVSSHPQAAVCLLWKTSASEHVCLWKQDANYAGVSQANHETSFIYKPWQYKLTYRSKIQKLPDNKDGQSSLFFFKCIYKDTHAHMCVFLHLCVCIYKNTLIFLGTLFPSYKPAHPCLKQIIA